MASTEGRPFVTFTGLPNEQNIISFQDLNATTAKTPLVQFNQPLILSSLAVTTDQRGILSNLMVSGKPVIGSTSGVPVRILAHTGQWAERALWGIPGLSITNGVSGNVTLDAAGDFSLVGGVDQLEPGQIRQLQEATFSDIYRSILLGTDRIASLAAGASDDCKSTLSLNVDGVYMMFIDGPIAAIGDVTVTQFEFAGANMLGSTSPAIDASFFVLGSRVYKGLTFYLRGMQSAPYRVRLQNNTGGALANLHVGFVRVGNRPAFKV